MRNYQLDYGMNSQPLNASEHLKVIFAIILGPILALAANLNLFYLHESLIPIGWLVSVIPLILGYFMMRKNRDFEYVEITTKFAKMYFRLLFFLSLIVALGSVFLVFSRNMSFFGETLQDISRHLGVVDTSYYMPGQPTHDVEWANVGIAFLVLISSYSCIVLIQRLYFAPLSSRRQWVVDFGIFSKEHRHTNQVSPSDLSDASSE